MWDENNVHEIAYVVIVNYLHIHFQDVKFNVLRNGTSAKHRQCYPSNRISSFSFVIVMFLERAFWLWRVEAVVGLEAEFGNNMCLQCAFYISFCNSLGCWQVDTSPQISPVVQVCKVSHFELQRNSTLTIVLSVTNSSLFLSRSIWIVNLTLFVIPLLKHFGHYGFTKVAMIVTY